MMNMSTDWALLGGGGAAIWCVIDTSLTNNVSSQHCRAANIQPPRGAGLYLDTWTRYLVYIHRLM